MTFFLLFFLLVIFIFLCKTPYLQKLAHERRELADTPFHSWLFHPLLWSWHTRPVRLR